MRGIDALEEAGIRWQDVSLWFERWAASPDPEEVCYFPFSFSSLSTLHFDTCTAVVLGSGDCSVDLDLGAFDDCRTELTLDIDWCSALGCGSGRWRGILGGRGDDDGHPKRSAQQIRSLTVGFPLRSILL